MAGNRGSICSCSLFIVRLSSFVRFRVTSHGTRVTSSTYGANLHEIDEKSRKEHKAKVLKCIRDKEIKFFQNFRKRQKTPARICRTSVSNKCMKQLYETLVLDTRFIGTLVRLRRAINLALQQGIEGKLVWLPRIFDSQISNLARTALRS